METIGKQCFVIMPFGEKEDVGGKIIDFDKVYLFLIKNTVESLGIRCVRCDEIAEAGWIHAKMFDHIYNSAVTIVDITSLNPNVFYELGVRHALAESVTVLIRGKGTTIPFNIQGFQVIEYDSEDMASVDEAKKRIVDFIKNGLASLKIDSPVHEVLGLRIGAESKIIARSDVFEYALKSVPGKHIGIITGDLKNVKMVDVWVNSENTNMRMARHFDRSISSVIRYLGAKKNSDTGQVVEDTIADELNEIMGDQTYVVPGTVIVTGAGELEKTHNVKKILHAASVVGHVGSGYVSISDVGSCVHSSLERLATLADETGSIRSILFPLMGTGTARGKLEVKTQELIDAAISYFEANPSTLIEKVYFLARTEDALSVCQETLERAPETVVN